MPGGHGYSPLYHNGRSLGRGRPVLLLLSLSALFVVMLFAAVSASHASTETLKKGWESTKDWSMSTYSSWIDGTETDQTEAGSSIVSVTSGNDEDELTTVHVASTNHNDDKGRRPKKHGKPVCKRTLLFKLQGRHGFSAEYGIMLKAALVASVLDYELFVDDQDWNYGSLSDYFDWPIPLCSLPPLNTPRKSMKLPQTWQDTTSKPVWTRDNHVEWKRDIEGLDRLIVNMFVDRTALDQLALPPASPPLSFADTLPAPFKRAREALAQEALKWWIPNDRVNECLIDLEQRLPESEAQVEEAEDASDPSLVIGLHVRRGDKYLEIDRIKGVARKAKGWQQRRSVKAQDDMTLSEVEPFLTAAIRAVNVLYGRGETDDAADWSPSMPKPIVVLMSDQPGVKQFFNQDERSSLFRFVSTADEEYNDKTSPFSKTAGFHETNFNHLPLEQRIEQGVRFVCEATVIAKHTDAIVMTGSSNVGRLLGVLASKQVIDDATLFSADLRWYPTSRYL